MTITLTREEAQQVLDALEAEHSAIYGTSQTVKAIELLRARLAQPEPEPVAWADKYDIDREGHDFHVSRQQSAKNGAPLYTAPPQHEWQRLTDEERTYLAWESNNGSHCVAMTEAKLKEKNT